MTDGKRLFSERDFAIIAAVTAIIITVGLISAFPNGLHLSPSHEVRYTGTDTTLLLGEIDVNGDITGTIALRNITVWSINAVGTVTVDMVDSPAETFVDPEVVIQGGDGIINGTMHIPTSLKPGAVVYNGSRGGTWAFAAASIQLVTSPGHTLTVSDASISIDNGSWTHQGTFSLRIDGESSATAAVDYCIVATLDTVELTVMRTTDLNTSLLDVLDEELPPLPVSMGGVVGVLPEHGATITVDGDAQDCNNVSLFRGSWTASVGEQVSLRGEALLVLIDSSLFSPIDAAIWFIPDKLLGLWPLAVGVWLVTSLLHRRYRQDQHPYDRELHWLASIIHLLMIVVSFFLWDAEVRYLFGRSMLDAAVKAITGSTSFAAWAITPIELVPWLLGLALIALPIRVILTGVLRLTGFDILSGGIAKAAGLLSLLFIGVPYIPFFLNVTVLSLLQNLLGL